MIKVEPIIGVSDVRKSSDWYQNLFDLRSGHGGDSFEMLADQNGQTILNLHIWGEHEHPTLSRTTNNGKGLIIYIKVDNLDETWKLVNQLKPEIDFEPTLSKNSGLMEFAIWDLDGYYLLVTAE